MSDQQRVGCFSKLFCKGGCIPHFFAGRIEVASPLGEGRTFTVWLPICQPVGTGEEVSVSHIKPQYDVVATCHGMASQKI